MNDTITQLGHDARNALADLGRAFLFGDGRCGADPPLWRSPAIVTAVSALAGATLALLGHGIRIGNLATVPVTCIAAMFAGTVVEGMFGRWIRPVWHGHCAECDLCSVHAGVPAARSREAANAALEAAGWLPELRGPGLLDRDLDLCPGHNRPEIVLEYTLPPR